MDGKQFIRASRAWAKANGKAFDVTSQGKGGHQTVFVGANRTTVKAGEIGPGLLAAMLRQLGIPKEDF